MKTLRIDLDLYHNEHSKKTKIASLVLVTRQSFQWEISPQAVIVSVLTLLIQIDMTTRSRRRGAIRPHSARWWRGLRLPTAGEVRFAHAYFRALKELAQEYVHALVKHCSRIARTIERGRREAFLEWALHPGMVNISSE